MPIRRQIAGTLHQAGKQSRFREREILQVLAEICICGLTESGDGEGAALSHVHLVGIELKNLLLGEPLLQLNRDEDLGQLAFELFLRREEESASHLHGNSGTALAI